MLLSISYLFLFIFSDVIFTWQFLHCCENILHQSCRVCVDVSVINVTPSQRAHKYLVSKGKSSSNLIHFKNQLRLIWFHLYHRQRNAGWGVLTNTSTWARSLKQSVYRKQSRDLLQQRCLFWSNILFRVFFLNYNSLDSSGFEHVFVGETKSGAEIVGFHNWIQFYLQEKNRHLDYKGYKARDLDLVS